MMKSTVSSFPHPTLQVNAAPSPDMPVGESAPKSSQVAASTWDGTKYTNSNKVPL